MVVCVAVLVFAYCLLVCFGVHLIPFITVPPSHVHAQVDVLRDHLKRLNARSQRSLSMSGVGSGSGDKIVKDQLSVASTRRRGLF